LLLDVLRRRSLREIIMETLYPRCAGIAVHKNNVVVAIRCRDRAGKLHEEVRTFATRTADWLALSDCLAEHAVSHGGGGAGPGTSGRSSAAARGRTAARAPDAVLGPDLDELIDVAPPDLGLAHHLLELLVQRLVAARPVDPRVDLREQQRQERLEVSVQRLLPRVVLVGGHWYPSGVLAV
jgi:hypothetical protein